MPLSDPLGLLGETVAGKYTVESVVGAGGFATVYRARHIVWERAVALKVFNIVADAPGDRQEELVSAFLREGAILAELSERTPAICQARDAGMVTTPAGVTLPYLVLEWLDGSTLAEVLDVEAERGRPPRTMAEAVTLLGPVADALALAHQRGIVHRDVKPANIFVLGEPTDERYALKLLDFGVAKVRSSARAMASTAGAFTAFTPSFAAPEQFSRLHGATGPWTDAYALALVLVEVVTRAEAQAGDDVGAIAKVACDPVTRPTPRTRGASVTDEIEDVFRRALAVKPDDRYDNAASLWSALHEALAASPVDPTVPSPVLGDGVMGHAQEARLAREADVTLDLPAPTARPPSDDGSGPLLALTTGRRRRRLRFVSLGAVAAATIVGVVWAQTLPKARDPGPSLPVAATSVVPARPAPTPVPACPEDMARIPGGSFFMGDDEGTKWERPAHQVHLPAYCMDRYEVTVAAYKACSDAGECKRAGLTNAWTDLDDRQRGVFDPLCNARDPDARAQHPINCVDWDMATHFCKVHGGRLPSEAEWEFAARGPDGRRYPWGDDPPSATLLNACGTECEAWGKAHSEDERAMYKADDGFATTAPVGSFPAGASRYGLFDVVGNVWEWVDDRFALYAPAPGTSAPSQATSTERVIRGGAWNGREPSWVRPTFRYKAAPSDRSYGTGFRCARDVPSEAGAPGGA